MLRMSHENCLKSLKEKSGFLKKLTWLAAADFNTFFSEIFLALFFSLYFYILYFSFLLFPFKSFRFFVGFVVVLDTGLNVLMDLWVT